MSSTVSISARPSTQASSSATACGAVPSGASPGSRSGTRARSGALGRNCSRMPPARQRWRAPPRRAQLLGDREPHPRRDLLGAQEIFVRGVLEAAAFERDQALVAAHVGALVDGHGEMAVAEQRAADRPCRPRSRRRRASASKRAQARTLPGVREVDHQHAHRPVGLGLQDEAALELQRGAEQHGQHDGLAEQLGDRRRIVVARRGSRRPPGRAAPRGRADRARRPRTAGWCRRRMSPPARGPEFRV